jgi:hypothetical protein
MKYFINTVALVVALVGRAAVSESTPTISAFQAPKTFDETLNNTLSNVGIRHLQAGESPAAQDRVWVYFIYSDRELNSVPDSERQILLSLMKQSNDGVLSRGRLEGVENEISVIVVDMENSKRSVEFLGCLAALDSLRSIFGNVLFSIQEMEKVCQETSYQGV